MPLIIDFSKKSIICPCCIHQIVFQKQNVLLRGVMAEKKEKTKGLKTNIYQDLKEKLINCVYPPGTILNELQLTADYGVSRTPVREAVSKLEVDGYLQVMPKKGIYVTNISMNDVMQIFQTRIEIEPVTLKMAAPYLNLADLNMFKNKFAAKDLDISNAFRLDTAMHLYIIEHCGNNYIIEMMRKVFDDNTRIVIASKQNQVKIHDATQEHTEILESLISKDPLEESADLMKKHIEHCRKAALDYFCSNEISGNVSENPAYKIQLEKIGIL